MKQEDIQLAAIMAAECHNGQYYGNLLYIHHVIGVKSLCNEFYGFLDKDLEIVAFLHDIIEDSTLYTLQDIKSRFGVEVYCAVDAISKRKDEPINEYIKRVKENSLATKVKIADTFFNLKESIKINDKTRMQKYSKQLEKLLK
jgi:(p)ppGpp synthase/HD superfamily hydrolase